MPKIYRKKFTKKTYKKRAPKKTAMNKRIATVAKAAVMRVAETKRMDAPAQILDYDQTLTSKKLNANACYMFHTFSQIQRGTDLFARVGASIQPRGIAFRYTISQQANQPHTFRVMCIKTSLPNTYTQLDGFDLGYGNMFTPNELQSPITDRINSEKIKVVGSKLIGVNRQGLIGSNLNKSGTIYFPIRVSKINWDGAEQNNYTIGNQTGQYMMIVVLDKTTPATVANPRITFQMSYYFKDL